MANATTVIPLRQTETTRIRQQFMPSKISNETMRLLKDFVERNSHLAGIHWDPRLKPRLLVKSFSKEYDDRKKTAHFFLFVAAISETKLIERAENARSLLVHLQASLENRLFETTDPEALRDSVKNCGFYDELGPERKAIPEVIASVNSFVGSEARGDLVKYSQQFPKPVDIVKKISERISRMGGVHREKSWMYIRWMVRRDPDLGIFDHFSPHDLAIPLTTDIVNVAACLGLLQRVEPSWWDNEQKVAQAREKVTEFSRLLFPEDPAKTDYPFFLLGRWMRGMELTETTLSHSLQLFDNVFKKTGYSCVDYQIVAYVESGWEQLLKDNLAKMKISYYLKPFKFPLPDNLVYTPDFVLKEANISGRKIILEPHGRMNEEDIHKYSLFRQIYEKDCFLLLIMRNDDIVYYRARDLLPEKAYDDVWPKEYLGILLTRLKNNQYHPLND
jgi:hypothetical protein